MKDAALRAILAHLNRDAQEKKTASADFTPRAPCQVAKRIAITPAAAGTLKKRRSTMAKQLQREIRKVPKEKVK